VTELVGIALFLSAVFLIAAIAHQESIPGVRQDWLIRPIPRGQLLLAKLLSVVVMVHVPMLLSDLFFYVVGNGVPIGRAVEAALSRNVFVFLVVSMPLLAFLSLVRNVMEAVVGTVAMALSLALFVTVTNALHWQFLLFMEPAAQTGLAWVPETLGYAVAAFGAIAILGIQYLRRRTGIARALTAAVWVSFGLAIFFLPWKPAFAIEERLAPQPGMGSAVELSFDPTVGKLGRKPRNPTEIDQTWYLPIRIVGLPPDTILRTDLSYTRVVDAAGKLRPVSIDKNLDFHNNGPAHLRIEMNPVSGDPWLNIFNALQGVSSSNPSYFTEPFDVEIELSMTLFRLAGSSETAPLRRLHPPGVRCAQSGWEASSGWDDPLEGEVTVNCSPAVKMPPCFTLILQDIPSPYVLRPSMNCSRDYRPYWGRLFPGGEVIRATAFLRDPAGQVHYPDGLDDVQQVNATFRFYEPADHFTRKLTITGMRLKDWTSEQIPKP
jgi:hypothetical protein